jgi:excisionase family DNA binding protein
MITPVRVSKKPRAVQWLTVGEVARHLRVSRDTVERWIHNGNLRAVNVGSRSTLVSHRCCWRVSAENLEAFLEGRVSPLPLPPSPKVRTAPATDVIEFIK